MSKVTSSISLGPSETTTFVLTGSDLTVGSGMLSGAGDSPDSVEGTLTFLVRSGGNLVDSIGVTPSAGLLRTAVPFEDFTAIGLALANDQPDPLVVRLILRNESGSLIETVDVNLGGDAHVSRFLNEYFSADTVTRGRVDLESGAAFYGTAITLLEGQLSTLPLRPSSVLYDVRTVADDLRSMPAPAPAVGSAPPTRQLTTDN